MVVDGKSRNLKLTWNAPDTGSQVDHYEVYGSDERGFSISRVSYPVVVGGDEGVRAMPPNLLAETGDISLQISNHCAEADQPVPCFFRVVAVDASGSRSGASDFVSSPRPFIYSVPPRHAVRSATTSYQLLCTRSCGDLRSISDGPTRYQAAFRDGDTLCYLLNEGPPWVSLGEDGVLVATPGVDAVGTHTVTIRVLNGQGGVDIQGFDLKVTDG